MPPVFCAVTRTAAPRGAGLPPVRAASPSACGLATSPPGAFQSQHGQLATGPPLPRPLLGQRLGDPLHGETGASTALVTPHAAALEALEPSRAWHASSAVHSQRVVPPPPAAPNPEPTAVRCGAQRHVSRGGGKLQRGGPPGESLPCSGGAHAPTDSWPLRTRDCCTRLFPLSGILHVHREQPVSPSPLPGGLLVLLSPRTLLSRAQMGRLIQNFSHRPAGTPGGVS